MGTGLYTVIVVFDGHSAGMQVFACTVEGAMRTWLSWGRRGGVPEHFSSVLRAVESSELAPREEESLQHVWSLSQPVGDQRAFVHVVLTVEDDPSEVAD